MTYLQFHLLFNLPVTLVLYFLTRGSWTGAEGIAVAEVLAAVMVFTSPWDNWAVQKGIWDFPPTRTLGRIGYLPWEEYLFFIWQSVNVIGLVAWLLRAFPGLQSHLGTPVGPGNGLAALGLLAVWIWIGKAIRGRKPSPRWNYARHLLYWFLPVIAVQWAVAPGLFLALLPVLGIATLFWGTYYVIADLIAVRAGIWYFDPAQITGVKLASILPWEEIAFFYLTSLLVAQSYLLLAPAAVR